MKVLIDGTMLDGQPSGAATRLKGLGAAHREAARVDVSYVVRPGIDPLPGLRCLPCPGMDTPLRRMVAARRLETLVQQTGADLLVLGALPVAAVSSVPVALTLHDLRFLQRGPGVPWWRRLWAARCLPGNLRRVAAVIAVSQTTASGVLAHGLMDASRVHVVPNGPTPGLSLAGDVAPIADFRSRLGLNQRYVLTVGPLAAHKAVGDMLAALAAARTHPEGADLALVLAGRADPDRALTVAQAARRLGVEQAIAITGWLSDDELSAAMSGAEALLLAGRHEGFSIPALDAMALGLPVVGARAGALPETCGEAALLVPPGDAEAAGEALVSATEPGPTRERLIRAGRQRAAAFSWDEQALRLEGIWEGLVAEASSNE
ncbi:MAG: glycosyltransferase involved in cell wall biosynthesis [Pseudohongiellaceae bacterium]